MIFAFALGLLAAVLATIASAAWKYNVALERAVLGTTAAALLVGIGAGWQTWGTGVHSENVYWLMLVTLTVLAVISLQWLLLLFRRDRQRLAQAALVTVVFGGMITATWLFG